MDLSFGIRESQGVTILDLKGRLTLGEECIYLHDSLRKLLAEKRLYLLLNLSEVTRVDSSGIGTLVEMVILTSQMGGRLKLLKIPRLLHNSLVIHRLLQAFEIFNNEDEAVAGFHSSAPASA